MKVWNIEKWRLAFVLFALSLAGLIVHGEPQQSALTFQPGIVTTIAGSGVTGSSGDGGVATSAKVSAGMKGVAVDASGDVFFIDNVNFTVRVVYGGGSVAAQLITAENPTVTTPVIGNIYVIAGVEGSSGTPANGKLASGQKLSTSNGGALCLDAAGDIYY